MASSKQTGDKASASPDETELTSPANLRKLVLNYLVHHCYADTAIAFARDGISDPSLARSGSTSHPSFSSAAIESSKPKTADTSAETSRFSYGSADTSNQPQTRAASGLGSRQAHPLSAPPLSREDSSMDVEADSLLALASSSSASNGHQTGGDTAEPIEEDEAMAEESGASRVETNGHGAASDSALQTNGSKSLSFRSGVQTIEEDVEHEHDDLPSSELRALRIRKEIRGHILCGRIRAAVELCNEHFPTVLDATSNSKGKGSIGYKPDSSASLHESSRSTSGWTSKDRCLPANPTSLDPAHLLLNLQIQAFIEMIRSASSSSTSGSAAPLPPGRSPQIGSSAYLALTAPNIPGIAAASISRSSSPVPSSSSSNGSGTSVTGSGAHLTPAIESAIEVAARLHASVSRLPKYWHAMYMKELEQVSAMLAYRDVEHSPVRGYLHRARKVALAEQINSAILYRMGKSSQPLIESAARQTSFVLNGLHTSKVPIPLDHPVHSMGGYSTRSYDDPVSKKNGNGKVLPSWHLRHFLAER